MRVLFLAVILMCVTAAPALAQNLSGFNPEKDEPLEITADDTLEWHRDDRQYIARGNVVARQGQVTIKADILTADYRDKDGKNFDIYRLTAAGHVIIESRGNNAYGDKAVYNVDQGVAVMMGDDLRMVSPEQTLTARDSFEYWVDAGRFNALGGARVVRGEDVLTADKMTAWLVEGADGKRALDRVEAYDHVVITTPTEILRGDNGVYTAQTNIAEMRGNVKIERGPNILEGAWAEVDLTTNISKMHGGSGTGAAGGDTRVRGVFYPGSEKKDDAGH